MHNKLQNLVSGNRKPCRRCKSEKCQVRGGFLCELRQKDANLADSLVLFDGDIVVGEILYCAKIKLFAEQDPNAHVGKKRYYAPKGPLMLAQSLSRPVSRGHTPIHLAVKAVREFANEDSEYLEAMLRLGGAEAVINS